MKKKTAKKKATKRPTKTKPSRKPSPSPSASGWFGKSALQIVLFGPPGVGKTDFCSRFPKPGFIIDPGEEGIKTLAEYGRCPDPVFVEEADDWEKLLTLTDSIAAGDYDIQTAVFESCTGFEKLCFHYHCREYFDNDWSSKGFYSYQTGPKNAAKTDWPVWLNALADVRKAGINVVITAHSVVKNYNNPEGPDYERYIPYLDKETWQQTHRWAKAVLFYNYFVDVDKSGPRNKARQESEVRNIYTEWSPAFDAKNQYGLPPLIDAGGDGEEAFANFVEAMNG